MDILVIHSLYIPYIYTYKTTLRVIRRFGGGGRGWKGFSAPSQTESHEHLCPKLLSMVVVCFLWSILRVVMSRCLVAFLTKSTTNIIFGKYLSSNAAPSRCNDKNPLTSRGWCFLIAASRQRQTQTHRHRHRHRHAHTHTHTHKHTNTHTHTQTHRHIDTDTLAHTQHTQSHKHTHTQTHRPVDTDP